MVAAVTSDGMTRLNATKTHSNVRIVGQDFFMGRRCRPLLPLGRWRFLGLLSCLKEAEDILLLLLWSRLGRSGRESGGRHLVVC